MKQKCKLGRFIYLVRTFQIFKPKPKLFRQREQVEAMMLLRANYDRIIAGGKYKMLEECSLCLILLGAPETCDKCVWVIETGHNCTTSAYDWNIMMNYEGTLEKNIVQLRTGASRLWAEKRVKELDVWIKKYRKWWWFL